MVSNNVKNCRFHLSLILARDGFAKNYMESRPEAKKCDFFHFHFHDVGAPVFRQHIARRIMKAAYELGGSSS